MSISAYYNYKQDLIYRVETENGLDGTIYNNDKSEKIVENVNLYHGVAEICADLLTQNMSTYNNKLRFFVYFKSDYFIIDTIYFSKSIYETKYNSDKNYLANTIAKILRTNESLLNLLKKGDKSLVTFEYFGESWLRLARKCDLIASLTFSENKAFIQQKLINEIEDAKKVMESTKNEIHELLDKIKDPNHFDVDASNKLDKIFIQTTTIPLGVDADNNRVNYAYKHNTAQYPEEYELYKKYHEEWNRVSKDRSIRELEIRDREREELLQRKNDEWRENFSKSEIKKMFEYEYDLYKKFNNVISFNTFEDLCNYTNAMLVEMGNRVCSKFSDVVNNGILKSVELAYSDGKRVANIGTADCQLKDMYTALNLVFITFRKNKWILAFMHDADMDINWPHSTWFQFYIGMEGEEKHSYNKGSRAFTAKNGSSIEIYKLEFNQYDMRDNKPAVKVSGKLGTFKSDFLIYCDINDYTVTLVGFPFSTRYKEYYDFKMLLLDIIMKYVHNRYEIELFHRENDEYPAWPLLYFNIIISDIDALQAELWEFCHKHQDIYGRLTGNDRVWIDYKKGHPVDFREEYLKRMRK